MLLRGGKSAGATIKRADATPFPYRPHAHGVVCRPRICAAIPRPKAGQARDLASLAPESCCQSVRGIRSRLHPDRGIRELRQDRRQCQRRCRRLALTFPKARTAMQLDIIVPVLMSCALLWWVSRGMTWTTRLAVTAITLALIVCVVLVERASR